MSITVHQQANVYLDESRQDRHGVPICGVAAYATTLDRAIELEDRWQRALREYGMREFKASDLMAGGGEFRDKSKWPLSRRREVVLRFANMAAGYLKFGFGAFIHEGAFTQTDVSPEDLRFLKDQYGFCLFTVFGMMLGFEGYTPQRFTEKPLHCLFDDKREFRGAALRVYDAIKESDRAELFARSLTFGDSRQYMPLQAVDLLAHFLTREYVEQLQTTDWRTAEPDYLAEPRDLADEVVKILRSKGKMLLTSKPDSEKLKQFVATAKQINWGRSSGTRRRS